ncbi:hypothetical protein [Pseudomonas syringae group genomosp. 3]|uniref:Uncharacterized protein n=1 Tax=Pseudomonas syringae pv. maculicola TaxID=59511 RepID=A0A3M6B9C0_PSEYM|nr:hypothetical protein [Pseudomonas syringae group genomosp. 3]RMV27574.1 hypothetical protein ALP13_200041 [Pseudomonas syringae pv. maculicola]
MTANKPNDVRVSRELLERVCLGDASKRATASQLVNAWAAMGEIRSLLAQPADQQGEPDFYEVSGNGVRPGLFYTHPDWAMEDPRYTVTPCWRSSAQPATVKVVLPERRPICCHEDAGFNECLDEVAKLNSCQS